MVGVQAIPFSAICDDFVKAEGFKKVECDNDAAAKHYAAEMDYESDSYPVVYFKSDTTGEKAYEEFYVPGEKVNMERFFCWMSQPTIWILWEKKRLRVC